MKEIGRFLELQPNYADWMIKRSPKKANEGHYREEDPESLLEAKALLEIFYQRPNLELYRLLHQTGHQDFTPFEPFFRGMDFINCFETARIESGICGDPSFLNGSSE